MEKTKSLPAGSQGISTLLGIIIILAATAILFGGIFAWQYFIRSQTPITNIQPISNVQNLGAGIAGWNISSDNAGWDIYTSNKYGYQIKYPGEAEISTFDNGNINDESCMQISYNRGYVQGYVYIAAPDNKGVCGGSTGLSLSEVRIKDTIKVGDKTYDAGGWKAVDTSGLQAESLSAQLDNGAEITFVVGKMPGSTNNNEYNETKNTIYQILSTFKSTK